MSFVGNYNTRFNKKTASFSDLIKLIIEKHAPTGKYCEGDDECGRRGYFTHEGNSYMIRTWTINETAKGYSVSYDIFLDEHFIEDVINAV